MSIAAVDGVVVVGVRVRLGAFTERPTLRVMREAGVERKDWSRAHLLETQAAMLTATRAAIQTTIYLER